ncbi:MAG: SIMPL domain-containing protein [Actinobacteria bacterium]|nr:SIMPL domain-containing protein [Actinomycetota bacterium]
MTHHRDDHEHERRGRPGRVRVRGSASRWVTADHADVTFTVRRRHHTSAGAVALASEAYVLLDGTLVGAGGVVAHRTTVALGVRPIHRHDPETGRMHRDGFEATRSETVRFAPPADAGEVLRAIAIAVPDLGLAGPSYGLRDDHPVHDEVRAAAAADARRVASAYASGLGLTLGRVLRLTEPGLGGRDDAPPAPMMFRGAAAKADGDDADAAVLVELTSEDVEVTASIELDMELADHTA